MRFHILFLAAFLALSLSAQEKIRIACVGNSITFGSQIDNKERDSYPMQLGQMLGAGYEVRNYGFSARTMLLKADHPYMKEQMFQDALGFKPDIVLIKLGTNDSKDLNWKYGKDFEKDLRTMIRSFQSASKGSRVILCYPCKAHSRRFTINDTVISQQIIPIIRKTAVEMKLDTLDFHSLTASHPEWFADEIHPNPAGAHEMARMAYRFLTGKDTPHTLQAFPGIKTSWEGYDRYDFTHNGRDVIVVTPQKAAEGMPWIWRPAFFGAFASVDKDLLSKGFHVVYYDLTHLYGSPRSVKLGNEFYSYMTQNYNLSPKVTLEGLSRGGLFVLNWARSNTDKISCIYIDAPVCDMSSWPGKKDQKLWNDMKKEWELSSDIDKDFPGNPTNSFLPIVKAGLPVIAVCGDADTTVPMSENVALLRDRMAKEGGIIELITKKGCGHHPHSLENPQPISEFVLRYQPEYKRNIHIHKRGSLDNSLYKFEVERKARVAFLGGSITEMKGWKELVEQQLQRRFPHTEFEWVEAGISSLGSTPHAFRLEDDVLSKGDIDLLFVEAAVNDDTNHFSAIDQVRGMEGIIRHCREVNPKMDIIMLDFIWDGFLKTDEKGQDPDVILNHERVANHYLVPSIDLNREIFTRIKDGEFSWDEFGGTHPKPFGHRYYNAAIAYLLDAMWSNKEISSIHPSDHEMPDRLLDEFSYSHGEFLDVTKAKLGKGWKLVSTWDPETTAHKRDRYRGIQLIESRTARSGLTLEFEGKAIGLYLLCGPEAAILEYSIDKGPWKEIDTYTEWSKNLYLPAVMMLDDELKDCSHTLRIRIKDTERTECQIIRFVTN